MKHILISGNYTSPMNALEQDILFQRVIDMEPKVTSNECRDSTYMDFLNIIRNREDGIKIVTDRNNVDMYLCVYCDVGVDPTIHPTG